MDIPSFSRTSDILVVIPAFDTQSSLNSIAARWGHGESATSDPWPDALIIDDGSPTALVKADDWPEEIHLTRTEENKGTTHSVLKGISYAQKHKYEKVILMDSDGQHEVEDIPRFAKALKNNAFAFGNRFHSGSLNEECAIPAIKIASNAFATCLIREGCSNALFDAACGFKGFVVSDEIMELVSRGLAIDRCTDQERWFYRYSFVYELSYLAGRSSQGSSTYVPIRALYDAKASAGGTRRSEILSLLHVALPRTPEGNTHKNIAELWKHALANHPEDFAMKLGVLSFSFNYIPERDEYRISCDTHQARQELFAHEQ